MNRTLVCVVVTLMMIACAPKGTRARVSHGERLGDEASSLLDDAEKALSDLDADRAEKKLREADRILKEPAASRNPDFALLVERHKALEPRVGETRAEKARAEVAAKVNRRREVIAKSVKTFRLAITEVELHPADRGAIEGARRAANQMNADIDWEPELQEKDPEFKSYVQALKIDVQNASKQLVFAERAVEFADGPARDHDEAVALVARAKGEKALDSRLARLQEAKERFARCNQRALTMIAATPGLDKAAIRPSGRPSTGAAIASACEAQGGSLDKRIAATQKILDERAKRAAKKAAKKQRRAGR